MFCITPSDGGLLACFFPRLRTHASPRLPNFDTEPMPTFRVPFVLAVLAFCACGDDDSLPLADSGLATFDAGLSDSGLDDIGSGDDAIEGDAAIDRENPTWAPESHESGRPPDYATVFPDDRVHRIELTITPEDWAAMQADLAANMRGGGGADLDFTPIWVEGTLTFDGADWLHTGIRYKGNSSLSSAYRSRDGKFPFKLDFDEWEDTYPSVQNQRFYGFKQLNLGSNYMDSSFMREKVASDLFRAFGVPAAHAAFCEVWIDKGEGPEFAGIYTLVEEVDDTVCEEQFADDTGNLYKPDGDAATFAAGTFDTAEFDLKTNEEEADYADVRALYDVLHDPTRTTDEAAWMASLEAVFDVDHFLRYLAVNQVIQNWDTYGMMTHNYFLYADEGVLTWIPWDNNEALTAGRRSPLSLGLGEVSAQWPIIRYLIDIAAYRDRYVELAQQFVREHFNAAQMSAIYDAHEATLADSAAREDTGFARAVSELRAHASSRQAAVVAF